MASPIHNNLINHMKVSYEVTANDWALFLNGKVTSANSVTARVFRGTYLCINSLGGSIKTLPNMVEFMKIHNIEMGDHCRSPTTLTNIVKSTSWTMHSRLTTHMKNTKDVFAIAIDGSTDRSKSNNFLTASKDSWS